MAGVPHVVVSILTLFLCLQYIMIHLSLSTGKYLAASLTYIQGFPSKDIFKHIFDYYDKVNNCKKVSLTKTQILTNALFCLQSFI